MNCRNQYFHICVAEQVNTILGQVGDMTKLLKTHISLFFPLPRPARPAMLFWSGWELDVWHE